MKLIKSIGIGVCILSMTFSVSAQNRVVTQHTTGTVVEGEVTMLVSQDITIKYRRTTSQGVADARLNY